MLPDNQSQWPETPPPPRRRGQRGAGIAATIAGVALFGILVDVGVGRWAITTFPQSPVGVGQATLTTGPRTGPIAAPNGGTTAQAAPTAAPTSTTTTDPTQQAVQQVIQQGDNEQAQAFESN